jgi:O-antigen/teichoic acid export membrane protein
MVRQVVALRRNSLFSLASQAIRLSSNFLLFVAIARFYGAEAFGQFTTAHTFCTVFLLFADFGFDALLATEIARDRDHAESIASQYFSLRVLTAVAAAFALVMLPLVHAFSSPTALLIRAFSLYILFGSLNSFFFGLFRGFEELVHETRITFISNLVLLGGLLPILLFHLHLGLAALLFAASRAVGVLLCFRAASQRFRIHFTVPFSRQWVVVRWRAVAVFGLHYVFGVLFFTLDTVLLALWRGDSDVAVYQSAFKIIVLLSVAQEVAVSATMPVLSRLHKEDAGRWRRYGSLLNKTLTLVALPFACLLFVFPDQVLGVIYGGGTFPDAVPILRIFGVILIIRFSAETFGLLLTTSQRQRDRMLIAAAALALNVALNGYAIPRYGPFGAVVVSLITNILVAGAFIRQSGVERLRQVIEPRTLGVIAIVVLLGAGLWQVRMMPFIPITVAVAAIYVSSAYFIGYTKEERQLLFAKPFGV